MELVFHFGEPFQDLREARISQTTILRSWTLSSGHAVSSKRGDCRGSGKVYTSQALFTSFRSESCQIGILLAKDILPWGLLTNVVQCSWFLICQALPSLRIEFLHDSNGRQAVWLCTDLLDNCDLEKLWFNMPQCLHLFFKDNKMLYCLEEWKWTALEHQVLLSFKRDHLLCPIHAFSHSLSIISYRTAPWMCSPQVETLLTLFPAYLR